MATEMHARLKIITAHSTMSKYFWILCWQYSRKRNLIDAVYSETAKMVFPTGKNKKTFASIFDRLERMQPLQSTHGIVFEQHHQKQKPRNRTQTKVWTKRIMAFSNKRTYVEASQMETINVLSHTHTQECDENDKI